MKESSPKQQTIKTTYYGLRTHSHGERLARPEGLTGYTVIHTAAGVAIESYLEDQPGTDDQFTDDYAATEAPMSYDTVEDVTNDFGLADQTSGR